jgi:hypothetical protein
VESATIVVLGGSEQERGQLVSQLAASGLSATSGSHLPAGAPELLIVVGSDAAYLVSEARDVPAFAEVPILAIVPAVPSTATAEAMAAGATDVARMPVTPVVVAARCRNLVKLGCRDAAGALALSQINDVLATGGDDAGSLMQVLSITAGALGFERASLIAHLDGSSHAFVIAANDSEPMTRFTLAIAEYPEVAECIRTLAPVLIDDVQTHPLTAGIAEQVSDSVRGIAVIPVQWRGRALGAILLRKEAPGVDHLVPRSIELG